MLQHQFVDEDEKEEEEDEKISSYSDLKIAVLNARTGLSENFIREAFESEPVNITDSEKIVNLMRTRHKFWNHNNTAEEMYNFVYNISGISQCALISIDAHNIEYYENYGLYEVLMNIINKLTQDTSNDIPYTDGFPYMFNFQKGNENKINNLPCGRTWYPSTNNNPEQYARIGRDVLRQLNIEESEDSKLLYHGTSVKNAMSVMSRVKVTSKEFCSDFGMFNFYTTDIFYTACKWAKKENQQGAVVIFNIPNEFLYRLNVLSYVYHYNDGTVSDVPESDTDNWRKLVFKLRNPPRSKRGILTEEELLQDELIEREYEEFIDEVDSYDLVEGPICSNPGAKTPE